ncbi:adenylosuccinate synthetase [Muricauda oceani]|uniref:Adenylosuccinate synthetase n=1 Tax=Flagellimonas oceani TaxID=2698672 RepID=A0A6G7J6Y4_9FLAO|nr:adenylosuccinate synthetase [Allomuricauda oceani]MBW8242571.1 adenylosuccinate synthetase [Allomuricauda oceani]QII46328.1 AAA family ATPase [Allomuricauda oceani]
MRNRKIIIIISGEIACGKSSICQGLEKHHFFKQFSTRKVLEDCYAAENGGIIPEDRSLLQQFGEAKDKNTDGSWVLDQLHDSLIPENRIIIDSARISPQIAAFRRAYGDAVCHIHLKCPRDIRLKRFVERGRASDKFKTYEEAVEKFEFYSKDKTEMQVKDLEKISDLVVHTEDTAIPDDHVVRISAFLRILPNIHTENVDVVVGGQFGSEGKGQIAAYLAPEYSCLVRVGGPNAGHKVYNNPSPDVFHIIPSGANKNKDSVLVIGPGAVISVEVLLKEIKKFEVTPDRLVIDENATIISNDDIRIEEELDKIGSTKQGVGAATANNLFINRLNADDSFKARNQNQLKAFIGSASKVYEEMNLKNKKILLEGTQGTFLSIHHGLYPYVTSRETTAGGCLAEAGLGFGKVRKVVMVVRRYPIRVQNPEGGSSGEFMSREITLEAISKRSGYPLSEMQKIEKTSTTKKNRRIAEFNWRLFRKACELNTPTDIAFTFSDYISYENQNARRYNQLTPETMRFIEELERCAEVPVSLIATRFSYRSIIDKRNWI